MLIKDNKGLTLIMLIITITVFIILSTVVYLWIDPAAIIKDSRDKRRTQDVLMLSNAFTEYSNENQGTLPVSGITTDKKVLCSSASSLTCDTDTETCLVPDSTFFTNNLPVLPVDPEKTDDTDTGYYITKDSSDYLIIGSCDYENTEITYNLTIKDN